MQDFHTKLQLKSLNSLALVNAPKPQAEALRAQLPLVKVSVHNGEKVPGLMVFVKNRADVQALMAQVPEWLQDGGLLWVAYPKTAAQGGTDINRDSLWKEVEPLGWRPVRQIALDEVWSALRFTPGKSALS